MNNERFEYELENGLTFSRVVIAMIFGTLLFQWHFYLWWKMIPWFLAFVMALINIVMQLPHNPLRRVANVIMAILFIASIICQSLCWLDITNPGVFKN
jgi:hypothetical protein